MIRLEDALAQLKTLCRNYPVEMYLFKTAVNHGNVDIGEDLPELLDWLEKNASLRYSDYEVLTDVCDEDIGPEEDYDLSDDEMAQVADLEQLCDADRIMLLEQAADKEDVFPKKAPSADAMVRFMVTMDRLGMTPDVEPWECDTPEVLISMYREALCWGVDHLVHLYIIDG